VRAIDWGHDKVRVLLVGGEEVTAKTIICTVSLGVLKSGRIRFSPVLPLIKQRAIDTIGMGATTKLLMLFRSREVVDTMMELGSGEPAARIIKSEGLISSWWQSPGNPAVLVGYTGAQRARKLGNMTAEEATWLALGELEQMFGRTYANELLATSKQSWHNHPYTLGSYSYEPLGMLENAHDLLARNCRKLFFAGEATVANGNYGTVCGAIESGERAAKEALEVL
jgi:monoamine oxidase